MDIKPRYYKVPTSLYNSPEGMLDYLEIHVMSKGMILKPYDLQLFTYEQVADPELLKTRLFELCDPDTYPTEVLETCFSVKYGQNRIVDLIGFTGYLLRVLRDMEQMLTEYPLLDPKQYHNVVGYTKITDHLFVQSYGTKKITKELVLTYRSVVIRVCQAEYENGMVLIDFDINGPSFSKIQERCNTFPVVKSLYWPKDVVARILTDIIYAEVGSFVVRASIEEEVQRLLDELNWTKLSMNIRTGFKPYPSETGYQMNVRFFKEV